VEAPGAVERSRRADRRPRRRRIENQTAGDRHRRRIRAEDIAVPAREHGRRFEAKAHEPARTTLEREALKRALVGADRSDNRDAAENLRRALMEPDARAVLERLCAWQHIDRCVGEPRLLERSGRDEGLTA